METAIVAPTILLIVFAIIQIAFVFRSGSITTTASRAGARVGAAQFGDATPANQPAVRDAIAGAVEAALDDLRSSAAPGRMLIYEARADGLPLSGSTATCGSSCIEYRWDDSTDRFSYYGGTWTDPDNCGVVVDRLGVFVEVEERSSTPMFKLDFDVSERTVMRLEPGLYTSCTVE